MNYYILSFGTYAFDVRFYLATQHLVEETEDFEVQDTVHVVLLHEREKETGDSKLGDLGADSLVLE